MYIDICRCVSVYAGVHLSSSHLIEEWFSKISTSKAFFLSHCYKTENVFFEKTTKKTKQFTQLVIKMLGKNIILLKVY